MPVLALETLSPGLTQKIRERPETKTVSLPIEYYVDLMNHLNQGNSEDAIRLPSITSFYITENPDTSLSVIVPASEELERVLCMLTFHVGSPKTCFIPSVTGPLATTIVSSFSENREEMSIEVFTAPPNLLSKDRAMFTDVCVRLQLGALQNVISDMGV